MLHYIFTSNLTFPVYRNAFDKQIYIKSIHYNFLVIISSSMRDSRQVNQLKNPKFSQIKQLQYFKRIFKSKQDSQLKQILLLHIYKTSTKILDHQNFVYVPEKPFDDFQVGLVIEQPIVYLNKPMPLLAINRKLHEIIQHALVTNIPVLQQLKTQDRFAILNSSMIQKYAFNRPIFRKGQQFQGIYYIINGQVKIISDKTGHLLKTIHKGHYIGLLQYYHSSQSYMNTIISGQNNVRVLFIDKQCLQKYQEIEDINIKVLYDKYYEDFERHQTEYICGIESGMKVINLDKKQKSNKNSIKLNVFAKKSDEFRSQTTYQDKGFNQYIKSKKVLLQLRQSMCASKQKKHKLSARENLPFKVAQMCRKQYKLNTNLLRRRSDLFKQNILKRLQNYDTPDFEDEIDKHFCRRLTALTTRINK